MRAEELVRRADEDVAAPRRDVDRPVRAVVHGIDPRERAGLVRELDDPRDIRTGPDRVRRRRERDDLRPRRALRREVVEVEREIVVDVDELHDDADVLLQRQPWRDVRIVVEPRHEHLVRRLELPGERPGEEEVERGHALAERDLLRRTAEERACLLPRTGHERVRPAGRLVGRADVGVVRPEIGRDRVDHLVRALRPARPVEEREPPVERREARADRVDVEQRGAHETRQSYVGCAVRDAPTKQSRSPFISRSASVSSSGLGSNATSAATAISTNANRPSSARRVTVPRDGCARGERDPGPTAVVAEARQRAATRARRARGARAPSAPRRSRRSTCLPARSRRPTRRRPTTA